MRSLNDASDIFWCASRNSLLKFVQILNYIYTTNHASEKRWTEFDTYGKKSLLHSIFRILSQKQFWKCYLPWICVPLTWNKAQYMGFFACSDRQVWSNTAHPELMPLNVASDRDLHYWQLLATRPAVFRHTKSNGGRNMYPINMKQKPTWVFSAYSNRQAWANTAHPDWTPQNTVTLFATVGNSAKLSPEVGRNDWILLFTKFGSH